MEYEKKIKLFEELRRISKEFDVVIMTAQQPQRKPFGYPRVMRFTPHVGEGRVIGFFPMDHVNLI